MKGGVGKSTTAYNLAAGLVQFKKQRVLLVDIDPQGNSSATLASTHNNHKVKQESMVLVRISRSSLGVKVKNSRSRFIVHLD
jgi:cellulose biosynthesis protein BcsQ